jgi:rhamnulokinase
LAPAPLHLAIDLGAGSGRAMVGGLGADGLTLRETHRFHYGPRHAAGHLRWDIGALFAGIRDGLRAAPEVADELGGSLTSVGVDSWGVE